MFFFLFCVFSVLFWFILCANLGFLSSGDMPAATMFSKFKSSGTAQPQNPIDSNPIVQHFEISKQTACAGPELVWKIHDGFKKSDGRVSILAVVISISISIFFFLIFFLSSLIFDVSVSEWWRGQKDNVSCLWWCVSIGKSPKHTHTHSLTGNNSEWQTIQKGCVDHFNSNVCTKFFHYHQKWDCAKGGCVRRKHKFNWLNAAKYFTTKDNSMLSQI